MLKIKKPLLKVLRIYSERLDVIERRLDKRDADDLCAAGTHEWEARESYIKGNPPYIVCKNCSTAPEKAAKA